MYVYMYLGTTSSMYPQDVPWFFAPCRLQSNESYDSLDFKPLAAAGKASKSRVESTLIAKMKRPLSPSALNATAARTDLAVDRSCDDAIVVSVASPAGTARPARDGGGGDSSSKPTATAATTIAAVDDGPPAHRTKSVVCMLLLVVGITASFIAWHLTIGRGPQPPTFLFHQQCNNSSSKDGCCNGLAEICDLPINEVLFATVHNAHSSREDFFLRPNHRFGLGRALEYGYRALLLDVCSCPPMGLVFCHGVCGAGTVSTEKVFGSIRQFLLGNPNEVLLLEYQMHPSDQIP